jgi:hypothetical protein
MARMAVLTVPYATVKEEAASLSLDWSQLEDVSFTTREDGSAFMVVRAGGGDGERLLDHLLERGFAQHVGSSRPPAP